ncbi:MAG: hypothetical protein V4466_13085 [Pseudomonadota bacterium]
MVRTEDLRPGSIVRLASGSPKMVVSGVDRGLVHVTWWSERLGILKNAFAPVLLVYPRGPEAASALPEAAEEPAEEPADVEEPA